VLLSRLTYVIAVVKYDAAVVSLGFSGACKVALDNVETFVFASQLTRFGIYIDLVVEVILVELVHRGDRVRMMIFVCKMICCGRSRVDTVFLCTLEVVALSEAGLQLGGDFLVRKD
jgi:hypothetical protein